VSHLPFAAVTTADAGEPYYSLGRLEGATKNEPAGKASTTTWSGVASPKGAVSKFDYGHQSWVLGPRAEPEPSQELRLQQRQVMAGSAIDLNELASPQILSETQKRRFPDQDVSLSSREG